MQLNSPYIHCPSKHVHIYVQCTCILSCRKDDLERMPQASIISSEGLGM